MIHLRERIEREDGRFGSGNGFYADAEKAKELIKAKKAVAVGFGVGELPPECRKRKKKAAAKGE